MSIDTATALNLADKSITLFLTALELIEAHNVSVEILLALRAKAKQEGREITPQEVQRFLDMWQTTIDEIPVKTGEIR